MAEPNCTGCTHYLDKSESDQPFEAWGYGGACVHPTNYHKVVFLISPVSTSCGRFAPPSPLLQQAKSEER